MANQVVVVEPVLGLIIAGFPATLTLITHGTKAFKLVDVRFCAQSQCSCCDFYIVFAHTIYFLPYISPQQLHSLSLQVGSATTIATALSTAPKIAATTTAHTDRHVCRKCGITNKSGKLSCCARGGAWFKKCGDAGDSNFDHTWLEGVLACKSSKLIYLQ